MPGCTPNPPDPQDGPYAMTPQPQPPLFPPSWFVERYNEANPSSFRSGLDPLVMMAWHIVTESARNPKPFRHLITGC